MTSSGTTNFNLSNGGLLIEAFERVQIRAPSFRQEHMDTAKRSLNLALVKFNNKLPNLWKVSSTTQALTSGTGTYTLTSDKLLVVDVLLVQNYGLQTQTDLYMTPLSRTEFASISNKNFQGQPTSYWFNRQIIPTLTLFPVPNSSTTWTLFYYYFQQIQDANLPGGETPDIPYRWLDALAAELAHRLSRVYAPQLEQARKADAKDAWDEAAAQDTENVNFTIAPDLSGYYRR